MIPQTDTAALPVPASRDETLDAFAALVDVLADLAAMDGEFRLDTTAPLNTNDLKILGELLGATVVFPIEGESVAQMVGALGTAQVTLRVPHTPDGGLL